VNKSAPKSASKSPLVEGSVVTRFSLERRSAKQIDQAAVELADLAIDMAELENTIKELPCIDAARVVDIHNRITAGEYEVDSKRLAAKLIDMESSIDPSR